MTTWESVIGLEIHVRLATKSKIFSGASTAFGGEPNTQASPVDLGLPGVLPVLNQEAVRMAVIFGLAINAKIAKTCRFDRKNYFYPDLPKGYQISQLDEPIVGQGSLTFDVEGSPRTIGITRAHLEEDAGKSLHENYIGLTGIDLNRAGTPLLEIVSDPDLRSPDEAGALFRELHALVRYLRISDGNLSEGSMRCDTNVSVRPFGSSILGERTEIKNVNSFRFVEHAIRYESQRQIDVLEAGGKIVRETRLYDAERNETRSMRLKELSDDYRYFPDPDLLPVRISSAMLHEARESIPELPGAKRQRYINELGLSDYDARVLTDDPDVADYFEACVEDVREPKLCANWIMDQVMASLHHHNLNITKCPVSPQQLGKLTTRISDTTLSSKTAKTVFDILWNEGGDVDTIVETKGLRQISNSSELEEVVSRVLAANPEQLAQFKAGKTKVLGFFVGQIMRATEGKANPQQVTLLLRNALAEA
jgi:aspartyl-tRNA(Asn)/glutamyl-tRNA(Gln) amidotransferase subunit B